MAGKSIDIEKLTLEELSGITSIYPWFALARKELCARMAEAGILTMGQLASAAMYMSDRRLLPQLLRTQEDYSDAGVSELVKHFVCAAGNEEGVEAAPGVKTAVRPRPRIAGADFFTKDEYESVSLPADNDFFRRPATIAAYDETDPGDTEVCTETLARIYEEQGYPEQARNIYSKLILAYPEKSSYFAALIEKTEK